jgi:poly(A) polymerase Pap1
MCRLCIEYPNNTVFVKIIALLMILQNVKTLTFWPNIMILKKVIDLFDLGLFIIKLFLYDLDNFLLWVISLKQTC